jgi:hypothetical protein
LVGEGTGVAAVGEQGEAVWRACEVGTGAGAQVAPLGTRVGTGTGVAVLPRPGTGLAEALGGAAAAVGVAVGEAPGAVGATEGAAPVGVAVG